MINETEHDPKSRRGGSRCPRYISTSCSACGTPPLFEYAIMPALKSTSISKSTLPESIEWLLYIGCKYQRLLQISICLIFKSTWCHSLFLSYVRVGIGFLLFLYNPRSSPVHQIIMLSTIYIDLPNAIISMKTVYATSRTACYTRLYSIHPSDWNSINWFTKQSHHIIFICHNIKQIILLEHWRHILSIVIEFLSICFG